MHNKQFYFPFIIMIFLTLFSCSNEKEVQIDQLFEDFNGNDVPGAAVMVISEGKPVFIKSYGLASLDKKAPVRSNTNFRLASVTKQFTAMSIMILVERGQLSYESTLTDIFPGFPEYGSRVTVRHLLNHTSGLISYESLIPEKADEQILDRDVLDIMASQDSTYFAPGTEFRYSNSGYAVLAMIVEKISGKSFASFLKENIFEPLEMYNTVAYEKNISTVKNRAYGYAWEDSVFVFSDQSTTSAVLGDGGIYSSIDDLFRWDRALYTEKLVSRGTLEKAFTPGVLRNGEETTYGFGWSIGEYLGHRRIYHGGSTCGFRTAIHRYPDDRLNVIVLTNRRDAQTDRLAEEIATLFLKDKTVNL
ncbi:MAG: beta-lactamase family protein [Candidatus Latescibacteria bacterium]|nr:beta-lactamase family protein [Candidatus Latescibacterota bacterium]